MAEIDIQAAPTEDNNTSSNTIETNNTVIPSIINNDAKIEDLGTSPPTHPHDSEYDTASDLEGDEDYDETDESNDTGSGESISDGDLDEVDEDDDDADGDDDDEEEEEDDDNQPESLSLSTVEPSDTQKKVDEDRRNPQYIPKRGTFYEHDDRTADVDGADAANAEADDGSTTGANGKTSQCSVIAYASKTMKKWTQASGVERWSHDRFDANEQAPKSRTELVTAYGYDIRTEDAPPRARRRRRYGRGPNKYLRNWEDETAYLKANNKERKPPKPADFPALNERPPKAHRNGRGRREEKENRLEKRLRNIANRNSNSGIGGGNLGGGGDSVSDGSAAGVNMIEKRSNHAAVSSYRTSNADDRKERHDNRDNRIGGGRNRNHGQHQNMQPGRQPAMEFKQRHRGNQGQQYNNNNNNNNHHNHHHQQQQQQHNRNDAQYERQQNERSYNASHNAAKDEQQPKGMQSREGKGQQKYISITNHDLYNNNYHNNHNNHHNHHHNHRNNNYNNNYNNNSNKTHDIGYQPQSTHQQQQQPQQQQQQQHQQQQQQHQPQQTIQTTLQNQIPMRQNIAPKITPTSNLSQRLQQAQNRNDPSHVGSVQMHALATQNQQQQQQQQQQQLVAQPHQHLHQQPPAVNMMQIQPQPQPQPQPQLPTQTQLQTQQQQMVATQQEQQQRGQPKRYSSIRRSQHDTQQQQPHHLTAEHHQLQQIHLQQQQQQQPPPPPQPQPQMIMPEQHLIQANLMQLYHQENLQAQMQALQVNPVVPPAQPKPTAYAAVPNYPNFQNYNTVGGTTYFVPPPAQAQPARPVILPQRRPTNAIPILPPSEPEIKDEPPKVNTIMNNVVVSNNAATATAAPAAPAAVAPAPTTATTLTPTSTTSSVKSAAASVGSVENIDHIIDNMFVQRPALPNPIKRSISPEQEQQQITAPAQTNTFPV